MSNPIEDLVQAATTKNYTAANDIFSELMGEKITDALDQEKVNVASQIYNGEEPEEEIDDEDLEIDDEDLEDESFEEDELEDEES